jgi:hypothetical protein
LEAFLETFFEIDEKLAVRFEVRNVHKYTDRFVAIELALVAPSPGDCLAFGRHRPELPFEFKKGVRESLGRNEFAVIEPGG